MTCAAGQKFCPGLNGEPGGCFLQTSICETITQCGTELLTCKTAGYHVDCGVNNCVTTPTCNVAALMQDPMLTPTQRNCAVCMGRKCCTAATNCNQAKCDLDVPGPESDALGACILNFCRTACGG